MDIECVLCVCVYMWLGFEVSLLSVIECVVDVCGRYWQMSVFDDILCLFYTFIDALKHPLTLIEMNQERLTNFKVI